MCPCVICLISPGTRSRRNHAGNGNILKQVSIVLLDCLQSRLDISFLVLTPLQFLHIQEWHHRLDVPGLESLRRSFQQVVKITFRQLLLILGIFIGQVRGQGLYLPLKLRNVYAFKALKGRLRRGKLGLIIIALLLDSLNVTAVLSHDAVHLFLGQAHVL